MRSRSLIILLILHGIVLILIGIYITYIQITPLKERLTSITKNFQDKSEYKKYNQPEKQSEKIKAVVDPIISSEQPTFTDNIQFAPRVNTSSIEKLPLSSNTMVWRYNNAPIGYDVQTNSNVQKIQLLSLPFINTPSPKDSLTPPLRKLIPYVLGTKKKVTTTEKLPGRIRVAGKDVKPSHLSIFKRINVADVETVNIAQAIKLGKSAIPLLPKGEPGGYVIGRGKNIKGVLRFARIQHYLADWWADQGALISLVEWMNTQTEIKTDMNIEGGASLTLTNPKLSKTPLVFFTGHDPSNVRSRKLMQDAPFRGRFSKEEKDGMRKYLIEDGGFIYFDDCGVNAPAQEFLRLFMAQLRYAMPEHNVDRIPNNHEIYHNYYAMGGPPIGYDIFWWGTHPPKRNFLEGIAVGDHLSVIVGRRDYMCAMETVSLPSKTVHYSPGVYRFYTNVAIYALTHGGISDYSHYVPENRIADRISIKNPVPIPELR
jgi:hypothetical protein